MSGLGTVLVVDDNAENRALAQATLKDEGYVVVLAGSGEEALAALVDTRPDCVLLDIRMPGMDGIAVCERIRALPGGRDVPIVFATAQRDVGTFDRAHAAGGDDFMTKPYRPAELIARVAASTKLRRMAAERSEMYELIRTQRDDLMRLQLHKEQLIAFLVHDLKNPVNAIELHGQRILRDRDCTDRARDAALKIQFESQTLLRMITNLLDLSKADEGRLAPAIDTIELPALFATVIEAMRVRAQAGQVAVTATTEVTSLDGDPELVRRVLENLVDNAVRHSPEGSQVTISAERGAEGVVIRVADQGPGVPPDLRDHVFERFVQAAPSSMRSSRGLGLAFCRVAAEAHGGRIWIEDAAPGAVFCVLLPGRVLTAAS